jgi:CRP-like cAMP-binding protein
VSDPLAAPESRRGLAGLAAQTASWASRPPAPHEPQNELLSRLPSADRARLLACCEPVQLVLGQVLHESGEPLRQVYFPVASFISLIAVVDHHQGLEVGMIGREGMLGSQVGLGSGGEPFRAVVLGPGPAWRIPVRLFRAELARSAAQRRVLGRYVSALMTQRAISAGCLHYHEIGPRLARWLLMGQDRAGRDRFDVTHEFLANLLGVRRVGVTLAAGELQRRGLIACHRGELTVLDRAGLEAAACSCYTAERQAYEREMR